MPLPKRIFLDNYCYFITTTTAKREVIFSDYANADILIENIRFYRRKFDFKILGYVIMPDHFHALIIPKDGKHLAQIMRDVKSYTSFQINRKYCRKGVIWQSGYYDHIVRDENDLKIKLDYMHKNPVRAGLVDDPAYYEYSSFRNYYLTDNSVLEIDKFS